MPYKEKEVDKLFYSISEVATMFNVNASLIRFWEKEFDIIKPKKNKKGDRLFTKTDVESFKLIYHLVKKQGHTLSGAKEKLKNKTKEVHSNIEMINSLENIKRFLLDLKKELY